MMKKKMYNSPVVEYAEVLAPMMAICDGSGLIDETPDAIIGQ